MEKEKIDYDSRIDELQKKKEAEEEKERHEEQLKTDRIETRSFYTKMIQDLRTGVRLPNECLDFEDVPTPTAEEINKMSMKEHEALCEKMELVDRLRTTRKELERKETESLIASDIIKQRDAELKNKLSGMSKDELQEWENRTREL